MKLWEALKISEETGRKIRVMGSENYYGVGSITSLTLADCIDIKWEVEPAKVEVTKADIERAVLSFISARLPKDFYSTVGMTDHVCKELGL